MLPVRRGHRRADEIGPGPAEQDEGAGCDKRANHTRPGDWPFFYYYGLTAESITGNRKTWNDDITSFLGLQFLPIYNLFVSGFNPKSV